MIKLRTIVQEVMNAQDLEYLQYRMNRPAADAEHAKVLAKTGFWGKQGAGAIILAKSTKRILIPLRSMKVEQPGTWGVWGGAIDSGDDPATTVRKEMKEEVGYTGEVLDLIPLYVFKDAKTGFQYHNFLAVVPEEFTPKLNWETDNFKWVEFGNWPSPLHFGLKALIQKSGNEIKSIIGKV